MFAAEARGEVPEGTAERWAKHTPKGKKLPEHVGDKAKAKEAFVASFLLKCAAAGLTTPAQIAAAAEALLTKVAIGLPTETIGSALGGLSGLPVLGATLGLAAPAVLGYGAGVMGGAAHNQVDTDDADVLRRAALANAYRRRTVEAKTNAQVRQLTAADPSKYVVLG